MPLWRLTIRLFGNAPDGRRDPIARTQVLEDLGEVSHWMDLASREGEVIYAFIEPRPGWLQQFDRMPVRRRIRRHARKVEAAE
jgi:hypothetical protein